MRVIKQSHVFILLADDDATDRELFVEALNHTGIKYSIKEVSNGEEVFEYLNKSEVIPDVIILDLNMPVKDGRVTLKELKEKYKTIPVFIMSTSNAHFDVTLAYKTGANLFLVKPHDFKELIDLATCIVKLIDRYMPSTNFQ